MSSNLALPLKHINSYLLKIYSFLLIKKNKVTKFSTYNSAVEPGFSVVAERICEEKEAGRYTQEQNHCSSTSYISQVQTACFRIFCALFVHMWFFNFRLKTIFSYLCNKHFNSLI